MTGQGDYRAITNAKIATIKDGKRIVRHYQSGEKLQGDIQPVNDAPPFNGYVRGWFKKDSKNG